MADLPQPVLVYTRVRANRRNTVLLLGLLAVLVLIFAFGVIDVTVTFGLTLLLAPPLPGSRPPPPTVATLVTGLGTLTIVLVTVPLAYRHAARLVLWNAGARPVGEEAGRDLRRAVENLCIGAGLPTPQVYVVESPAANAFATGRAPEDASLVVTRGLLALLTRRELDGVIAHELSHIGNHDIRVGTILAGVGGALGLPARLLFRLFEDLKGLFEDLPLREAPPLGSELVGWLLVALVSLLGYLISILMQRGFFVVVLFVFFGAPLAWLLMRAAIWQERELLADADAAVLTRDPDGLALALVKVGAAQGAPLRATWATAHLYIVNPLAPQAPWWDRIFPFHPPIEERIALLARMGSGEITPAALQAAADAATALQQTVRTEALLTWADVQLARMGIREIAPATPQATAEAGAPRQTVRAEAAQREKVIEDMPEGIESYFRVTGALTPLYAAPDAASAIRGQLSAGTRVAFVGIAGSFLRVATADSGVGYVSIAAPKAWD